MYEAQALLDAATQQMRESGGAISQNIYSPNLKLLLKEHVRRLATFRKFSREMDRVNCELKAWDTLIADREAYYAQKELLDFIGSKSDICAKLLRKRTSRTHPLEKSRT